MFLRKHMTAASGLEKSFEIRDRPKLLERPKANSTKHNLKGLCGQELTWVW